MLNMSRFAQYQIFDRMIGESCVNLFLLSLSIVYMGVEKRILLEATLRTFLGMWSHGL